MPYYIDESNCIRKKPYAESSSPGALVKCFNDSAEAEAYLQELTPVVDESIAEFSMAIIKASYEKSDDNPRKWRAVDSDIDSDLYDERMSIELYQDFISRIENNTPVPEQFKSIICEDAWCGGMPYLSIAHYKAGNDAKNVPGKVDAIYIDGTRLKSKGVLDDSEMGRKVFDSLCDDLYKKRSGDTEHLPVRISIGFLDLQHKHTAKSGGQEFVFTRTDVGQVCPLCSKGVGGKIYTKGQLVHLALTRVPVNPRTEMIAEKSMDIVTKKDDARSIIADLADDLDERSLAEGTLVVRAEAETPATNVPDQNKYASCYDPNTDSYNQECIDTVLSANVVPLRQTKEVGVPVKSTSDRNLLDAVQRSLSNLYKSWGVDVPPLEAKMADEVKEPVVVKAMEEEKEVEKEEKEKEEDEVDKSFTALKSLMASGAGVDQINQAFAELGGAVERSYKPATPAVDMASLAEIVRSAVESAVAPLKVELAQIKAGNVIKSGSDVPVSRGLTIKPQDLIARSQPNQPTRKLTQIEMIARRTTGAALPE